MTWQFRPSGERRWIGHGYVITQSSEAPYKFRVCCGVRNVGCAPDFQAAQHRAQVDYGELLNEARLAKRDGRRPRRLLQPSE